MARHGIAAPRGQAAPLGSRGGRFGRMFGHLPARDPGAEAIEALATLLIAASGASDDNRRIPAGYTYLGQFVDHDLTFDPTSQLQRDNDPEALVNFRTPRFDLDSLYGSGPADQPFLYDWSLKPHAGVELLVDRNPLGGELAALDLPRNRQGRALIGDARNDENLIVSQLHLLFIRFHNRVVDHVLAGHPHLDSAELLVEAQRLVRWHYQWIVMHDFLARVAGDDVAAAARGGRHEWPDGPFMPVEFSGAAFRFGHSMVRGTYKLNSGTPGVPIFRAPGRSGRHLGGLRSLPAGLEIEWRRFFRTEHATPQMSQRIDPSLAPALTRLPPDGAALARRNLQRGRALGLPAGLDVAHAMGETPLTEEQLLEPLAGIPRSAADALLRATPLWYYVLCEARFLGDGGQRLGPVGGRIVAEVLAGLLACDPQSYLNQWPRWMPELPGSDEGDFTMSDLVRFTLDGAASRGSP